MQMERAGEKKKKRSDCYLCKALKRYDFASSASSNSQSCTSGLHRTNSANVSYVFCSTLVCGAGVDALAAALLKRLPLVLAVADPRLTAAE